MSMFSSFRDAIASVLGSSVSVPSEPGTPAQSVVGTPPVVVTAPRKLRIILLLDESGSMESMRKEAIEGVNVFVKNQQELKANDEVVFDIIKFSQTINPVVKDQPIAAVRILGSSDYRPQGVTMLYDAIGHALDTYGQEHHVILVVMTDGEDTSSHKYTQNVIRERLAKRQLPPYSWQVVWLAADATIERVGVSLGAAPAASAAVDFNSMSNYCGSTFSNAVSAYRTGVSAKVDLYGSVQPPPPPAPAYISQPGAPMDAIAIGFVETGSSGSGNAIQIGGGPAPYPNTVLLGTGSTSSANAVDWASCGRDPRFR